VPIENVTLISKLKLATPKGGTKAPSTDQIQATLTGVTAGSGTLYLTVTGTGVTASGAACQAQAAVDRGGLTTLKRLSISPDGVQAQFSLLNDPSDTMRPGSSLVAADRQAASVLASLSLTSVSVCDVDFALSPNGGPLSLPSQGFAAYGLENCSSLPAGCTGGAALDYVCGGPCPPCSDGQTCTSASECASAHCQAPNPTACYGTGSLCIPAHCFDGVKDIGETDIDCGGNVLYSGGCEIGCATGKACSQNCDCASTNCVANVCQ
jgi:hypothetical protein